MPHNQKHTINNVQVVPSTDGEFKTIDIRINIGSEEITLAKIDESDELGLRILVYPTKDTGGDQMIDIDLSAYQENEPVLLSQDERDVAIDRLNDLYQDSYETIDSVIIGGFVGLSNLSDKQLLDNLDMKTVEEFRERYGAEA